MPRPKKAEEPTPSELEPLIRGGLDALASAGMEERQLAALTLVCKRYIGRRDAERESFASIADGIRELGHLTKPAKEIMLLRLARVNDLPVQLGEDILSEIQADLAAKPEKARQAPSEFSRRISGREVALPARFR